jgi:uncharacterized cupin superfamily protein
VKDVIKVAVLLVTIWPLRLHAAPQALQLDVERLNATELQALEPFPDFMLISGKSEHWEKVLHQGEVVVSLYAAKPALLNINVPFPYDEFVWVLDGELTLTHVGGRTETYVAGDSLLVPKGFKGMWEMRGDYRELVVIETNAYESEGNLFKMAGSILASWFRDTPKFLPLNVQQLNRAELQPAEPTPADLELVDDLEVWQSTSFTRVYEGEFVIEVYATPPALVNISEPFPYDEFLWVLDGELALTPVGGPTVNYTPGDAALVSKGFMGTWEMRGNYRELIIIEAEAMSAGTGE